MTAHLMAKSAYAAPNQHALRTPRSVEYDIFAETTARLRAAKSGNFAALASALHENRKLWTVLAADLSDDNNALPTQLRAQLFYLCEFTFAHTHKVLARTESVDALIDVNTAVMRGLSPQKVAA